MKDINAKIMTLLKAWPAQKRQIDQLRFELEHPTLVGEKELIDSLSLGACPPGESGAHCGGISNKTMTIALQYQNIRHKINNETITGIMRELRSLESEVTRLEYYISLLDDKKANAVRLLYLEQKAWNDIESEMHISKNTISSYRNEAIKELAAMYSYLDSVSGDSPKKSGQ